MAKKELVLSAIIAGMVASVGAFANEEGHGHDKKEAKKHGKKAGCKGHSESKEGEKHE